MATQCRDHCTAPRPPSRYTWTLAIQFHFYLVLPLVWNYFGPRGLLRFGSAAVLLAFGLRVLSQWQMKPILPMSDELGFFSFFWYSFTLTRAAPIFYGVMAAYGVVELKVRGVSAYLHGCTIVDIGVTGHAMHRFTSGFSGSASWFLYSGQCLWSSCGVHGTSTSRRPCPRLYVVPSSSAVHTLSLL